MNRKVILPIVIVVVAVALTVALVKTRSKPQPHANAYLGPLVRVAGVAAVEREVVVEATGTVQARREASMAPQVSGRVSEVSVQLVAGGVFRAGELMFALEDVDYRLALEMARASLAQAELELARNENLAEIARDEWQRYDYKEAAPPSPLVLYEPQLKSARAQRDAALAALRQAELNLQRTRVVAPFNCYVRSETIDPGQFVAAGAPVARVAGTDQAEIVVPLPLDELAWLEIPRRDGKTIGSPAEVSLNSAGRELRWQGTIARALGEIDPRTRMPKVVVSVPDPFSLKQADRDLLGQLRPGTFVEVRLRGASLGTVFPVPRGALRDGGTAWVVDEDDRLRIRAVEIVRRERDEVLVRSGLNAGERIVLTGISGAAEGMQLRPQPQETTR